MESAREPLPPVGHVLAGGVIAGLIAGAATGAIDAVWSWSPAAQFVPHFFARIGFVLFTAVSYAAAGAAVGLIATGGLLVLSRGSRLGDLLRFAFADHRARRAADRRVAVVGLAVVLAGVPCIGAALVIAYRVTVPYITNRHVISLEVIVAMGATLAALAIAVPITFVLARVLEVGLARVATRVGFVSSVWAPFGALGAMVAIALGAWLVRDWETARQLPLRAPVVLALGGVLAIGALRPARLVAARVRELPRWWQRGVWAGLPVVLLVAVLATGGSAARIKAAVAYTGLGGPIARTVRKAFDWDRDGYSRFLGGGDCNDGDATVHPGAPEIPDDGIDQNCVGGDATTERRTLDDVGFVPVPPAVPKDFNILLVTIDTTRADHVTPATAPNIEKLAAAGTEFEHGWAHAPSTRYSMPAILTGRLPLDVYYDYSFPGWPGLSEKATTIAELVKPLGFVTGAITNYSYFVRERRMNQGIDEYDNENARLHVDNGGPAHSRGSSSKEQSDKAIAFVDRHAEQRWFLWVHYYDPHYSYDAHAGITTDKDDDITRYDGEIKYTDQHIGRLFDELRAKGLYDKTVVVITGDHGEGFGEHGVFEHGYHLYAAQTKVPMIMRVPGLPPRRSTTPAGHVDIMPTLVNLAGGTPSLEMMGRSLVDVLAGKDRERVVFQQLSYENNNEMRAGVDAQCHVIYNVSPETSWEVYRVDRDPMETEDLSDTGECTDTRHAVEHWFDRSQVPAGAGEALLPAAPTIASPLDADLGDAVRLLAVDAPAKVKPGDPIALTWTFEAKGRIDAGWKMFVHAEGPNKAFLNGDHAPARPFEWWRAGQFIRYTTTLTVPKTAIPGTYTVRAGMFEGNRRAPATAPHAQVVDNAVTVATIEVAP